MITRIDLHVHTRAHSQCSIIDPAVLVAQAFRARLGALVITEHHYQWRPEDLEALAMGSGLSDFTLLSGFEYSSLRGDILVYGLNWGEAAAFPPGLAPEEAVRRVHERGGACVAAHPTRAGMGFDGRILTLPLEGIEVCSVNLTEHERRQAVQLAGDAGFRPVAASDAHQLADVGRYTTDFTAPIRCMDDLVDCLKTGRFQLPGSEPAF